MNLAPPSSILLSASGEQPRLLFGFVRTEWAVALIALLAFTRITTALGSGIIAPALLALMFGLVAMVSTRDRAGDADVLVPFIGVAGLYAAYGLLSTVWARNPASVLENEAQIVLDIVMACGVIACISGMRQIRWAVWALIVGGLLLGSLALRQYLLHDYEHDMLGLAKAEVLQIVGQSHDYRSGGPVGDANFFGQLMVVSLTLSLERARAASTGLRRLFATVVALVSAMTVLITYSRGAMIAMAVVLVLAIAHSRRPARTLAVVIGLMAIALVVAPKDYVSRLAEVPAAVGLGQTAAARVDPAIEGRAGAWLVATRMFEAAPLTGVGLGNYTESYPLYSSTVSINYMKADEAPATHSLPLQLLATQGVLGFLLMAAVVLGAFIALTGSRRALADAPAHAGDSSLLGGIRDALLAYLVTAAFLQNSFPELFWVLIALGWSSLQGVGRAKSR